MKGAGKTILLPKKQAPGEGPNDTSVVGAG
jgi:hypothetical protein